MVFVTAGMGGGTGTGAAPVVAKLAAEAGRARRRGRHEALRLRGARSGCARPRTGIAELREHVDTLITIPNERLLAFVDRNTPWEAFKIADDVLRQACRGSAT